MKTPLVIFLICTSYIFYPSKAYAQDVFNIMMYNCENAFDTKHDQGKNDEEYLGGSPRFWNRTRYFAKLRSIGKVITAVDSLRPVDLVGLCEVENDSVLCDLLNRTPLRNIGYEYVMTNSLDERGIDVALLYMPYTFHLISHTSLRAQTSSATRDVLYVSGKVYGEDTLDVFVVHLPSKLGGRKAVSDREAVASFLKERIDSVMAVRVDANILVMGDFNSGPDSPPLVEILKAETAENISNPVSEKLYNLLGSRPHGSYKYNGEWDTIDQILVSGNLLDARNGISTSYGESGIAERPFLLEDDIAYGGKKPRRTYFGMKYLGGFSDHLPVYARFVIRGDKVRR